MVKTRTGQFSVSMGLSEPAVELQMTQTSCTHWATLKYMKRTKPKKPEPLLVNLISLPPKKRRKRGLRGALTRSTLDLQSLQGALGPRTWYSSGRGPSEVRSQMVPEVHCTADLGAKWGAEIGIRWMRSHVEPRGELGVFGLISGDERKGG